MVALHQESLTNHNEQVGGNVALNMARPSVVVEEVTITPVLAELWLQKNSHNRPISAGTVNIYARDMMAGNWQANGETIKFSTSGTLLDGQHRLTAIIESGVAIRTYVVFGLPDETFRTIDTGRRRQMGDVLAIEGEPNRFQLAAALHIVWRFERGLLFRAKVSEGSTPTHAELADILARHPDIRDSITHGFAVKNLLGAGMATGLHFLFAQRDRATADAFFTALGTGENLSRGNPVLTLRNRLMENQSQRARLPRVEVIRLVVKAWNAVREGRQLLTIKLGDANATTLRIL